MSTETVGRPMEILFVEDSLVSARLTMGALKKGNILHRLTWLTDGEEALDFLYRKGKYSRAPRPDLILLDLDLPKRDGREVLAEVKANDELQNIPIVILTGSTSAEDMLNSEKLHVEAYLTKPVDLETFLWLVKELKDFWLAGVILPEVE